MKTVFVNKGSDEALFKSLNPEAYQEELLKAIDKSKLVQVEIQVKGKNGMYTRKQWKKAGDVKPGEKIIGGDVPDKKDKSSSYLLTPEDIALLAEFSGLGDYEKDDVRDFLGLRESFNKNWAKLVELKAAQEVDPTDDRAEEMIKVEDLAYSLGSGATAIQKRLMKTVGFDVKRYAELIKYVDEKSKDASKKPDEVTKPDKKLSVSNFDFKTKAADFIYATNINIDTVKKPSNWDSLFAVEVINDYMNGRIELSRTGLEDYETLRNNGLKPSPSLGTAEYIAYFLKTERHPAGNKADVSEPTAVSKKLDELSKPVPKVEVTLKDQTPDTSKPTYTAIDTTSTKDAVKQLLPTGSKGKVATADRDSRVKISLKEVTEKEFNDIVSGLTKKGVTVSKSRFTPKSGETGEATIRILKGNFADDASQTSNSDSSQNTSDGSGNYSKLDKIISSTPGYDAVYQTLKSDIGKAAVGTVYTYTEPFSFGGETQVQVTKNSDDFTVTYSYPDGSKKSRYFETERVLNDLLINNDSFKPTSEDPMPVITGKGTELSVWKELGDFYASATPAGTRITNQNKIMNLKKKDGFETLRDVVSYVRSYF